MSDSIVKFKADSGQEITVTAQDVTNLICERATPQEVALFLKHCQAHRLDPFTKEAYLIKYGDKPASIVTNYNVFNARAQQFPDYEGIEDGVVYVDRNGEVRHRAGSAVYPVLGEQLIGGWASVYRKGKRPTYVELALSDYNTGQAKWKTSPGMMIDKCAKSAAWRTAYPSEFDGMYGEEEMEQAQTGTVEVQATVLDTQPAPAPQPAAAQQKPAPAVDLSPITGLVGDYMAATGFDKVRANRTLCEYGGVHALRELSAEQVGTTAEMMRDVIKQARDAQQTLDPDPQPAPQVTVQHVGQSGHPWDNPSHGYQPALGEEVSF